jgi:RHS repeat-associated protein
VIVTQGSIHGGYTTANSVLRLDDYCGNYLYENGTSASVHPLTKILTPEGYIDMSTSGYPYCYYKQDHLGSNREVTSYAGTTGTVVQQTEYYPSGTAYVEGTGAGIQPFKFTGKELITMHGLNWQDFGARWLDNVRMQWTTVDPLAEKYYSISPYAYCFNNPLKYLDPDGKDGTIAIKGNQITISANVYLYGAGATKVVAAQMQSDINKKWGGTYNARTSNGKSSFSVAVNVKVGLYDGKEKADPFVIPESWNPYNRDNFIEIGAGDKRSYVVGGDEGEWRSQGRDRMTLAQDDPAPHEVGHLLGLGDQYTDKDGANKGWEQNIMGNSQKGNVEQRNINGILKDAMKAYEKWVQDPQNKGKEFKYEINTNNPHN